MAYQNINQYNYPKYKIGLIYDGNDMSLASDERNYKEEVIFSPDVQVKDKSFKSPKIIKPMLGKRPRPDMDDELSSLFSTTSAI